MSAEIHAKYRDLLAKIEMLAAKQRGLYGDQIRCKVGCFSCCRPPETLFRVESELLGDAVAALGEDAKQRTRERLADYRAGQRELCPLLEEGGCQVYDARPVICRTHGYGVMLQDDEGAFLSWCELNFDEIAPSADVAFNVEHLNTVLSVMTRMGWPDEVARPTWGEVLEGALGTGKPHVSQGGGGAIAGEQQASSGGEEER
ncbi:MAG: YkgJ family cysteine cluster protein [Myxococcales bacterium]|nr:YkgJ family cysteine cluster protein [Myxococcales bacterium]